VLPADDLWWRPHDGVPSVGVLLRHLEGNVRQWIVSGVGGAADRRERAREFAGEARADAAELLARLEGTVEEACRAIEGLDREQLGDSRRIQGMETTVRDAIYHVVEHFSWHVGQVIWIAKARAGARHGIAFYDDAAINRAHNG
jgi:uncharacterized damage-inducible protein DinB